MRRTWWARGTWWVVSALVCLAGCEDRAARTQKQLEALQKKKDETKRAQDEAPLAPLPSEVLRLEAPFDDTQAVVLTADGPCPEGLWALFSGQTPGGTTEEKKANNAQRGAFLERYQDATFLVKFKAPSQVKLSAFDAPKGRFTVELPGTIDCTDALGRIALAWMPPTVEDPGKATGELAQSVWTAPPLVLELPMKTMAEAKAFADANRFGLTARLAFKAGKGRLIDKKLKKVAKVAMQAESEEVGYGGGVEDWGAGRMMKVERLGVRVATDRDRKELVREVPGP